VSPLEQTVEGRQRGLAASASVRARSLVFPALLSLLLVLALFVVERRIDFYVAEEGFLWYGAVATAHGQVPLRDFYSYDPGRYYWAAAWSRLLGDGILALRLSTALFSAVGLCFGLLAARRVVRNPVLLTLVALLLLLWMVPRNKLFEPSMALALVWGGTRLVERPAEGRCLAAGLLAGLALFLGKNHGLYALLGFLSLLLFVQLRIAGDGWRPLGRRLAAFAAGVALGASPLLLLAAFAPGFGRAYLDSILFFLRQGRTNFPLPVPWPWQVRLAGESAFDGAQELALGFAFLLPPLLYAAAAIVAARTGRESAGRRALLLASVFVGVFYLHHAFSRADLVHLGTALPPFLLGGIALPAALSEKPRRRSAFAAVAAALLALLGLAALPGHPLYRGVQGWTSGSFVRFVAAGDEILLRPRMAGLLASASGAVAEWVPPEEPLLLAPNLTGLYPLLGRRSPVYDIYPIWPAQGRGDERMLAELKAKHVRWALLTDYRVDGREDLRFSATHPQVWRYLSESFEIRRRKLQKLWGLTLLEHRE